MPIRDGLEAHEPAHWLFENSPGFSLAPVDHLAIVIPIILKEKNIFLFNLDFPRLVGRLHWAVRYKISGIFAKFWHLWGQDPVPGDWSVVTGHTRDIVTRRGLCTDVVKVLSFLFENLGICSHHGQLPCYLFVS